MWGFGTECVFEEPVDNHHRSFGAERVTDCCPWLGGTVASFPPSQRPSSWWVGAGRGASPIGERADTPTMVSSRETE